MTSVCIHVCYHFFLYPIQCYNMEKHHRDAIRSCASLFSRDLDVDVELISYMQDFSVISEEKSEQILVCIKTFYRTTGAIKHIWPILVILSVCEVSKQRLFAKYIHICRSSTVTVHLPNKRKLILVSNTQCFKIEHIITTKLTKGTLIITALIIIHP